MKFSWLGCLLLGGVLFAGTDEANSNVNTRYKVETVIVSGNGWSAEFSSGEKSRNEKISSNLTRRIVALVGDKLNPAALDDIAKRLRRELHTRDVSHRVIRGDSASFVRVVYDVAEKDRRFDVAVPKFLYNSKQGWSAAVEATANARQNSFTFGLVSDGDELAERYAGLTARYENSRVGSDRVHLGFGFGSYHDQWNRATLQQFAPWAAPGSMPVDDPLDVTSAPYRTRQNFEPSVTFLIIEPLTVSAGASFGRFQSQYPAAHTEAANAVTGAVRYNSRMDAGENQNGLEAAYGIRIGTNVFDSDFVYAGHRAEVSYELTRGKHTLSDVVSAGLITGRAPLYERFFLGNSSTLRGWNKFDISPIGGNRMIHNSVEYRYGVFEVFYDTGSVWDVGQPATPRHSMGLGLRQGSFALAVAFPVRSGRVEPSFMMGMNY